MRVAERIADMWHRCDLIQSITPVNIKLNGYRAPVNIEAILGDDYGISTMLYPEEVEGKSARQGKVETRLTRLIKRHGIPAIVAKLCGL